MIEIGELREKLSRFPDNYLVTAIEIDGNSLIGVYDTEHEVIGHIWCTGSALVLYNGELVLALDEIPDKVEAK